MTRLLALILLLGLVLGAQTPAGSRRKSAAKSAPAAAADARFPIETIRVLRNHNFTAEQIIRASGLKIGVSGSQKELEKIVEQVRNRLLETGFFDRVGTGFQPSASGKGYMATIEVNEMAQLFAYRFENLPVPAARIEAALRQNDPLFSPRIPGTQAILDRYAAVIDKLVHTKDRVVGKVLLESADEYVIVFHPNTPMANVAEVRFTGTTALAEGKLRAAVTGPAIGTPYSEKRFRQILELSARPVYEAQGYLRMAFAEVRTEQSKDVNGLIVTVKVVEGAPYKLREVAIDSPGIPTGDLYKAGKFQVDAVANFDVIEDSRRRVEQLIRRNGYVQVKTTLQRTLDDKQHTVSLRLAVIPGPRHTFRNLNIEGLDINGEAEVRKLWGMKEGKPFNAEYPDYFLGRVRDEGYFENLGRTSSAYKIDEHTHAVDVTLTFRGGNGADKGLLRKSRSPETPPQYLAAPDSVSSR